MLHFCVFVIVFLNKKDVIIPIDLNFKEPLSSYFKTVHNSEDHIRNQIFVADR